MKCREVYVAQAQTLADSGSLTWPLGAFGKVNQIRVKCGATNGATSNTVGKLKHWISKLEIVDGALVIAACSGLEWYAVDCFCNRFSPFHDLSGGAGVGITDELIIPFGRFCGDRNYYIDFSMYKNPLLRLTWANTVSATAGIATGSTTVSIIARTIEDQALPYLGFISRKEIFAFTTAASGVQPVLLPLDFPYAGIYAGAYKTTVPCDTIITNFKLDRNFDQFIDFNLTGRDAYQRNVESYGLFRQKFRPLTDTTATWLGDLYFQTGAWYTRPGATSKGVTTAVAGESVTTATTTGGTADANEITLEGSGPAGLCYLPFHEPNFYDPADPADYLNPVGLGQLRLQLTQGVASGAGLVVVEQLRQQ
jgi:hypothetical protein